MFGKLRALLGKLLDTRLPETAHKKKEILTTLRAHYPAAYGVDRTEGSNALLSVTDHGPGIPPVEQGRIFERFRRLGSELRRETEGVGIGLALVKHIAEGHHGSVAVQSTPGHGSRFTLTVPIQ